MINATEWQPLPPETAESLAHVRLNRQDLEILGLHNHNGAIRPGNFVGVVHIGDCILRVDSKFPAMDYLEMFLCCAAHPIVGEHMTGCLTFWPGQPPIETDSAPEFCGLVAAAFLRELNELRVRHFRRHFTRETANFTGKAKGKILVAENIRRNTMRGRNDRVFCAFQSVSDDIPENRILRAALERSAVLIANNGVYNHPTLHEWIRAGRAALQGVSVVKILPSDHKSARTRGAFAHYRRPLRLARAVLESSGFHLHEIHSPEKRQAGVSPFALNSAELFERWAELQLLENPAFANLQASYARGNTFAWEGGEIAIRPDFSIPARAGEPGMILDAKYKAPPESIRQVSREDIYQMVAYSRHQKFLRQKLNIKCPEHPVRLALLYPAVGAGEIGMGDADESFHAPLSFWRIPCPAKRPEAGMAETAETAAA